MFGGYVTQISRDLTVFGFPNWNLHSETSNPSHNSYNNIILGCIYDTRFQTCLLCVPKCILYSIMHTHFVGVISYVYVSGKAEEE